MRGSTTFNLFLPAMCSLWCWHRKWLGETVSKEREQVEKWSMVYVCTFNIHFILLSPFLMQDFNHNQPVLTNTHRTRFHFSHQSLDATILSDHPAGPSELGHIGDGLCSQALQLFVRRVQDGHHGLQTTQISDGLPNLRVTTDLLQDLQRTNLTARERSK